MKHTCLCNGRGWVLGPRLDSFARLCLLCRGAGKLSDYHLYNVGLFPSPPYGNMGVARSEAFLDAYAQAKALFELQSEVPDGVYDAVARLGVQTWAYLLRTLRSGAALSHPRR